jgi:hypothetical protein
MNTCNRISSVSSPSKADISCGNPKNNIDESKEIPLKFFMRINYRENSLFQDV